MTRKVFPAPCLLRTNGGQRDGLMWFFSFWLFFVGNGEASSLSEITRQVLGSFAAFDGCAMDR